MGEKRERERERERENINGGCRAFGEVEKKMLFYLRFHYHGRSKRSDTNIGK